MIKVTPNMNFSSSIARGTIKTRELLTEELNEKVFHNVLQVYDKKNTCGIGAIKTRFNRVLPENKNVNIKPLPLKDYDICGGTTVIEDNNIELTGYSIEIPVNKRKKFCIIDLPEFMHESTHIIDWLLNPKYVANYRKMCDKDIFSKDCYDIYHKIYDEPDFMAKPSKHLFGIIKDKTKKAVNDLPFDEKITFLKFLKFRMELENHAYKEEVRFAKLMKKLGKKVDSVSMVDYSNYMKIPQKINIIKEIISEEITKERQLSK